MVEGENKDYVEVEEQSQKKNKNLAEKKISHTRKQKQINQKYQN